jgi:aldose 1-epimerase
MRAWKTAVLVLGAAACAAYALSCQGTRSAGPAASKAEVKTKMSVEKTSYGKMPDGREVDLYTLTNPDGMRVRLTSYGAITVSVEVPDRSGKLADVTLGYDTLQGWLKNTSYFGATVGRYANRIAKAKFTIDGKTYALAANNGENAIHGGIKGFDKVLWKAEPVRGPDAVGVRFTYRSRDGEEGYPGNLSVTAVYSLTKANELKAELSATTDKPTVVNLAHHSYWNLGGAASGDVLGHLLTLNADKYTLVDAGLIPTGELKAVAGTPMDFTKPAAVGERIAQVEGGYDHNYVLRGKPGELALAARLTDPTSGRTMELWSDQPGVQFYSGNFLDGSVTGKGGIAYKKYAGLCLETQHFPDSPNHPDFPSAVLRPGQTYRHVMIHKFSAR